MSAGMSSSNDASRLLLPAAVTNRMSGALANASVRAPFAMSKYSRASALRSTGLLPIPHTSRSASTLFTLPPQLMLTTRAVLLHEIDGGLHVARVLVGELARRTRVGKQRVAELDPRD